MQCLDGHNEKTGARAAAAQPASRPPFVKASGAGALHPVFVPRARDNLIRYFSNLIIFNANNSTVVSSSLKLVIFCVRIVQNLFCK